MFRTRCAPSPTGYLHIGGLKTFFFAYLCAKQAGGKWILRIEDTDRTRLVDGAVEAILRGFRWAGLELDEGPVLSADGTVTQKGEFGPYVQSERFHLYGKYAQELVEKGFAYHCFCTSERLDEMRRIQQLNKQAPKYDRTCLGLSADEVSSRIAAGEKYVIRMKVPEGRTITVDDKIKGRVVTNTDELDDQVLLKSDGFPTYHLAVVVDDHLMEITHVIRADEWLPSTPKHVLLYEAFGWELPVYAHVPPLLAPGGKKKLSKREGAVSVDEFASQGYLPEAMLNYLVLSGWNPGTTQEIFTMEEMIEQFTLERCQKAGAVFDIKRLDWMNGQYIRRMAAEELTERLAHHWRGYQAEGLKLIANSSQLIACVSEIQPRLVKLADAADMLEPFFSLPEYDASLILSEKMKVTKEIAIDVFSSVTERYAATTDWMKENLQKILQDLVAEKGYSNGQVFWPVRAALSGRPTSPGAFEMAFVLGRDETLRRLQSAVEKLR